jgi:hypothetical protein
MRTEIVKMKQFRLPTAFRHGDPPVPRPAKAAGPPALSTLNTATARSSADTQDFEADTQHFEAEHTIPLRFMADPAMHIDDASPVATYQRNAQASWDEFPSHDYWQHNYHELQPEDQEIIRETRDFFVRAFTGSRLAKTAARCGVDVGAGTNLYPALLMLPWAERLMLTDFSAKNVNWLRQHVADDAGDDDAPWSWSPFWAELQGSKGYSQINEPRKQLRKACTVEPEYSGIEKLNVFKLPKARWDLGTMFFVAESITEDPDEFHAALESFLGALKPGAPFATAFMAGSDGYDVADIRFPALPVTPDDVTLHLTKLGADELTVEIPVTPHRVRKGYSGMVVATGYAGR